MTDFIRRRELDFQLWELFALNDILEKSEHEHLDRATVETVLDTAMRVATDHFASNADLIDRHEPELVDGKVVIDDSVKTSVHAFAESGFIAGGFAPEKGGMGLPQSVVFGYTAIFNAANVATAGYGLLTVAAAHLLETHGSDELRERYFDSMLAGETLGTMALSEPQAGSSLGDLRTSARPAEDGTYRVTGSKMWISGAGHDMTPNILHLVLARIEGAPAGTRGISLFAVPRWIGEGAQRRRNDVDVAGLNHKMGYRGITNTVLNFGEQGGAVAYLVGEPHRGLRYMFQMMNEARIGVGLAAVMSAHNAYLYAVDYARERKQGRHPDGEADTPPIPIIEHADVRRMLLQQRAYIEGGWAVCMQCAALLDEDSEDAHRLVNLLTPIAKAWPSNWCLKANELAMQVLGGYGYSREYPVERHYRDNRLNAIHEGTNGIQAMDLLGRKVAGDGGTALRLLLERMQGDIAAARAHEELAEYADALAASCTRVGEVSMALGAAAMQGEVRRFLANASVYLDFLGHVVVAWQWLRMATIAAPKADDPFYAGKLVACRYFYRWELPQTEHWARLLEVSEDTPFAADPANF